MRWPTAGLQPPPPPGIRPSLPATPPIIRAPYKNRGHSSADHPGPLLIREPKKLGTFIPAFPILGDATNVVPVILSPPKRLCVATNFLIYDVTSFFPQRGSNAAKRIEQKGQKKNVGTRTLTKLPPGPPLVAAGADLGAGYMAGGALVVMAPLHTDVLAKCEPY